MKISEVIQQLELRKSMYGDIELVAEKHDDYGHRKLHCFAEPKFHVEKQNEENKLIVSD